MLVLFILVALGGLIWWVASPAGPKAPSPPTSFAAGTNEVRQATAAVTQAGTVMSLQLASGKSLPTVRSVSTAVDPYLTALRQYQSSLSGAVVSPAAGRWQRTVLVQVHSLMTLLGDLAGTPSGQLGSWIKGFYLQTAELQSAIEGLQAALSGP